MAENSKAITWWIIIIVIIVVVIGAIWWYYAGTSSNSGGPSYSSQTQSSDKAITSFVLTGLTPPVNGVIDENTHSIDLTVPKGTDVTKLAPSITVSDNATVSPVSGTSEDFTSPVTYTVTAQDGSAQDYTVTVTVSSS
ncbi:MAG: DUF5018 domain-containing protein [Candidatus Saccharimonadales bacterium]